MCYEKWCSSEACSLSLAGESLNVSGLLGCSITLAGFTESAYGLRYRSGAVMCTSCSLDQHEKIGFQRVLQAILTIVRV